MCGCVLLCWCVCVAVSDLPPVQVWKLLPPHLWRNPDQEGMGHDRRPLCGQVRVKHTVHSSRSGHTRAHAYSNMIHGTVHPKTMSVPGICDASYTHTHTHTHTHTLQKEKCSFLSMLPAYSVCYIS